MNTNKHIKNQISRNGVSQEYLFVRDGVSQHDRLLTELEPDYVAVDERDLSDLLTFVQEYATKLNYYDDYDDSYNVNGDWLPFFNADVEQMVAYIHNPESFADDESTLKQLSQPHLVLLFTFLQLLRYPQQQFQALTQRYLDFYYKEVLKLTTKQETPDKINVIFELAQGEEAHLIKQGTLLNAGQDSQGINLNYATDEDIIVNQAQIASVKTLFVGYTSLEDIHLQDNKSDQSFENMLRWAVGSPNQGDQLPNFNNDSVDIDYLKKNIYEQFGKNGINKKNYIKDQLFFENVGDFLYCMRIHYKEINDKNPAESEWNKVYQIIEAAYNKKNINTPDVLPIDQTEIQNIYANSIVDTEEGQATIPEYFNTFGNIIETPQNSLGFAVASPLFLLQEGVRTITLTFICKPETWNQDTLQEILDSENEVFEIYLSSGTQWIQPQSFTPPIADEQEPHSLKFELNIDSTQPAILPPQPDESTFFIATPYPVVKILLKQISKSEESQKKTIYYQQFKSILLEQVNIHVTVTNIKDIQLRNDNSVLDTKTPFQPFGYNPKVGSGFYFANREISQKKLDSLTIEMEWMGLPQDFATHYQAYSSTGVFSQSVNNSSFEASLKLLNHKSWVEVESPKSIFTQEGDTLSNPTSLNSENFINITGYSLDTSTFATDTDDPFEQSRYFKLELESRDFAHDLYPIVLNKVALATDIYGNDIETKSLTVYPAYTPEVKAISLNYTASEEINLQDSQSEYESSQIFQIHPFGYADIHTLDEENSTEKEYYLLPQYDEQGNLYIGIRNLQPPQDISILFQMVAGSGNVEVTQPQIHWSYLSGNSWQGFQDTQMLADSTNGLVDAGIIRLSIPETATSEHNLLPSGLHWLRATVKENAVAIPDILDIKTQAVRATFVNQGNAAEHLSKSLAANSIQGFVTRDPAIKTLQQPYTSFGGKPKEDNRAFTMRVSERLRHKQRAITAWDYERLVLEHFPQIYKAKCITAAAGSDNPRDAKVTVVVIPDISNTAPFFPLEPKAPLYLLKEIEAYLKKYTSPFVQIVVKNPSYEPIQYSMSIRFHTGYEQGYYLNQLNEDIKRFLSPWAYEQQADITFGSSIHNSSLIYFIEKRPYVDYVANLQIKPIGIKGGFAGKSDTHDEVQKPDSHFAQVQHPDSILVSAPEHIIEVIDT